MGEPATTAPADKDTELADRIRTLFNSSPFTPKSVNVHDLSDGDRSVDVVLDRDSVLRVQVALQTQAGLPTTPPAIASRLNQQARQVADLLKPGGMNIDNPIGTFIKSSMTDIFSRAGGKLDSPTYTRKLDEITSEEAMRKNSKASGDPYIRSMNISCTPAP